MRGRRPRPLTLDSDDSAILQWLARCRSQPWFQIQHARILLGIAAGQRVKTLAREVQCDAATVWRICRGYEQHGLDAVLWEARRRVARSSFPPLQRAQIVQLACLEPIAKGLHITHWTSRDLARQAVEDGIVPAISDRTIQAILDQVDLQPHRTRYWRTSQNDARFKQSAEKIL